MSLRVVINQSNYIPWKGYFDLIHDADLFIFLDNVQYTKNDWRNRNRVKGANGSHWLTIPIGVGHTRLQIDQVPLPDGSWRKKHWKTLTQCYSHAPFFSLYSSFFEGIYLNTSWRTLSEMNQTIIEAIAKELLGIKTQFMTSAQIEHTGTGENRILSILRAVHADCYISGPAARNYLDPFRVQQAGFELIWKDYGQYPKYPQLFPPFDHNVSIVDLLFNTGASASSFIWGV